MESGPGEEQDLILFSSSSTSDGEMREGGGHGHIAGRRVLSSRGRAVFAILAISGDFDAYFRSSAILVTTEQLTDALLNCIP